jgi:YHS domain-containing protein
MKARWLLLLAFAGALTFGSSAFTAEEKEKEFDCKCVVSGAPAKEDKFVEKDGKKVYFCCENCPKAYEKDPDKFTAKVHHQWAKTDQIVQVACPFSGEALDPEQKIEVDGERRPDQGRQGRRARRQEGLLLLRQLPEGLRQGSGQVPLEAPAIRGKVREVVRRSSNSASLSLPPPPRAGSVSARRKPTIPAIRFQS